MSMKMWMSMVFMFVMCQFICATIDGAFIGTVDSPVVSSINDMFNFSAVSTDASAFITIGWNLITNVVPKMILWDYACFDGGMFFLRLILMAVFGSGIIFGLWQMLGGMVQSILGKIF